VKLPSCRRRDSSIVRAIWRFPLPTRREVLSPWIYFLAATVVVVVTVRLGRRVERADARFELLAPPFGSRGLPPLTGFTS
jgi:hypothetical protein